MVLDDQYYQRKYCAKIFPSPLVLTLQIHFYPSFSVTILDCALKVIALKSATFSAPESAAETNLETTYFKKLVIKFVSME